MAQASKAIIPKDAGGPFGQRIGVSLSGSLNWALVVGAYQTERVSSSDFNRYSIVVMNWFVFTLPNLTLVPDILAFRDDSSTTTWNPQPVKATIEFRGKQATYTFPVGVTTLWWFAAANTGAVATVSPAGEPGVDPTTFTPWNSTVPSNITSDPNHYRPRRSSPL